MKTFLYSLAEKEIAPVLRSGGIGVLPTDTLYGLVGSAFDKRAVERIYMLRKRDLSKPMIVLISSLAELELFGIAPNSSQKKMLKNIWPAKVSVILPCPLKKFEYLHRGSKSIAFRIPENASLRSFLKKTGPLVAPSANIAGKDPAITIEQAKRYFNDRIDFYVDAGKRTSKPSTLVSVDADGQVNVERQGVVKLEKL